MFALSSTLVAALAPLILLAVAAAVWSLERWLAPGRVAPVAAALLAAANERIAAYDSAAFDDLLVSGETVVAHGWNGGFFGSFD